MELSRRNVVTHASAYLSIIIEALEFLEIKWNTYVLNNSDKPPRMCKISKSKMKSDSAIGQHLIKTPEYAKTYSDDNFRIIGQARSSFHLSVLESVHIKTQNPVLCKQKELIFSLGLFK